VIVLSILLKDVHFNIILFNTLETKFSCNIILIFCLTFAVMDTPSGETHSDQPLFSPKWARSTG